MVATINYVCWSRTRQHVSVELLLCSFGIPLAVLSAYLFFRSAGDPWSMVAIVIFAVIGGLLSALMLKTFARSGQIDRQLTLKTVCAMSLISLLAMEIAMNTLDVITSSGKKLNRCLLPVMLPAGFLAFLPYKSQRLQAIGKVCQ